MFNEQLHLTHMSIHNVPGPRSIEERPITERLVALGGKEQRIRCVNASLGERKGWGGISNVKEC